MKVVKEITELLYWNLKRISTGKLSNDHYFYYYTDFFSIKPGFYHNKRILDIGCGPRGSLEWATMSTERVGIDPLSHAYLKMGASNNIMSYIKARAENLPFQDEYFDVVSSFNSLDHVDNVIKSCLEIKRILKKGGLFLLIVDIHKYPTPTEPQTLNWNFIEHYFPEFNIVLEKHLKKTVKNRIYSSIKLNIPVSDKNENGVLVAAMVK